MEVSHSFNSLSATSGVNLSAKDVLSTYPPTSKMMYNTCVRGDTIGQVLVVDSGDGWDFWNNFTPDRHWHNVFSLSHEFSEEYCLKILEGMLIYYEEE